MITRYVDPDSAGGNGTTAALSGANAAYASQSIAEAAISGTLTDSWEIICGSNSGGHSADTTAVNFSGATTTSSFYIYFHSDAASKATPPWSTSKYRLSVTDVTAITISEGFVRISDLQLETISPTAAARHIIFVAAASNADILIFRNILRCNNNATFTQVGINHTSTASSGGKIYNNLVYNLGTASGNQGIRVANAAIAVGMYNNTVVGGFNGLVGTANVVAINNLCQGQGAVAVGSGTFAAGTDYNATNRSSMGYTVTGGGNTHDRVSQTFTFVNAAGEDYHLASTDTGARNFGVTDPGTGLFSDDIDGGPRSGTWDIGCDEYIAPFSATGALATKKATIAGIAAFTPLTFTATGSLATKKATISGVGTFTQPTFAASGSLATKKATIAGAAAYSQPTFSAAGSLTTKKAAINGAAAFSSPIFTASGALSTQKSTISGTAAFSVTVAGILRVMLPAIDGSPRSLITIDGAPRMSTTSIDAKTRQLRTILR